MGKETQELIQNSRDEHEKPRSVTPDDTKVKFSFEDQLTFAPKLNSLSLKIVAETNRTSITDRKKKEKKIHENTDFVFKPTVSNNSNKIIAKLKTGFLERQNIHVQRQKEKLEKGPSTVHPNFRSIPPNNKDTENDSRKCPLLSEKTPLLQNQNESPYNKMDERLIFKKKMGVIKKSPPKNSRNKVMISPRKLKNCRLKPSEDSTATLNSKDYIKDSSEKCINQRNACSDISVAHKVSPPKLKNRHRSLTFPQYQSKEEIDEKHQQLNKIKKIATEAMKNKKIFICNGSYSALRASLRKRGWIEKDFKSDSSVKPDRNSINDVSDNNNAPSTNSLNSDFFCDGQYGIMSRIVRNATPTFIWTISRNDIDFRFLCKDQMMNHYSSAWSFTTKAGLSSNLRNVHYFIDRNANDFFPRCYRICCDEEKAEFIEDFRLTAVISILKIIVLKHTTWESFQEKIDKDVKVDSLQQSQQGIKLKKCKLKVLPVSTISLVMKACYNFLDSKKHLDIEESYVNDDRDMWDIKWRTIIDYYYQIVHKDAIVLDATSHVEDCKVILSKIKQYHPQMNIDGYHNMWILKPGAKSRGRGIVIKDRLDDILNMTSDNVSTKENRWVIQKYIEQPFLVYRTKFDIRQWFLVTDWNPLIFWFYKDSYIRFCGQEFTMDNFDPQFHLSNNSIQKHYEAGERSEHLPDSNMWSSDEFKAFLLKKGFKDVWEDVIYVGMKEAISAVLQTCQDTLEYRKNSFELYGADFMLSEDLKPWLIEINSSPALGPSTDVTERLCRNVIDDTLKVVLDRRENKQCDIGSYELAYKQQPIAIPSYMGCNISVDGAAIKNHYNLVPKIKLKALEVKSKMTVSDIEKSKAEVIRLTNKPTGSDCKKNGLAVSRKSTKSCPKLKDPSQSKFTSSQTKLEASSTNQKGLQHNLMSTTLKMQEGNNSKLNAIAEQIIATTDLSIRTSIPSTLTFSGLLDKPKILPQSCTENKVIENKSSDSIIYRQNTCSCCGKVEEEIIDVQQAMLAYDVKKMSLLSEKIKTKKNRQVKCKKQFGILASEDISGIRKLHNYPALLVNRYDSSKMEGLHLVPGYGVELMKDF